MIYFSAHEEPGDIYSPQVRHKPSFLDHLLKFDPLNVPDFFTLAKLFGLLDNRTLNIKLNAKTSAK
jgi:hypothetical protein